MGTEHQLPHQGSTTEDVLSAVAEEVKPAKDNDGALHLFLLYILYFKNGMVLKYNRVKMLSNLPNETNDSTEKYSEWHTLSSYCVLEM